MWTRSRCSAGTGRSGARTPGWCSPRRIPAGRTTSSGMWDTSTIRRRPASVSCGTPTAGPIPGRWWSMAGCSTTRRPANGWPSRAVSPRSATSSTSTKPGAAWATTSRCMRRSVSATACGCLKSNSTSARTRHRAWRGWPTTQWRTTRNRPDGSTRRIGDRDWRGTTRPHGESRRTRGSGRWTPACIRVSGTVWSRTAR